ncbi:hypothetical protein QT316_01685 [Escherichia coli]|uniref:hypothetical protein n=1 Tax=Escherichia coli TaxID=562 RepID=UPI00259CAD08|nr:hypothetical protein [Escherichia coli]MDM4906202.1 hypothetical protein [Escherichia coli]
MVRDFPTLALSRSGDTGISYYFCYQLIINKFFSTEELKTSKLTTQLTTHFVEALRTTTNNNKQKGNLLAVLLNRYHFPAIRHEAGGCFFYADLHSSK